MISICCFAHNLKYKNMESLQLSSTVIVKIFAVFMIFHISQNLEILKNKKQQITKKNFSFLNFENS